MLFFSVNILVLFAMVLACATPVATSPKEETISPPAKETPGTEAVTISNLSDKTEVIGDTSYIHIYGEAINNTDRLISYVDFRITFYDADGKIVGTAIANMANLPAGGTKTFEAIGIDIENATRYKVDVGTVLFG